MDMRPARGVLPERYRSALVACELEGKSRREAAGQLGIPEGTLSTHLAQGRKLLRELDHQKEVNPWASGFFEMVELLTAPPDRRKAILDARVGGPHWRPGAKL